MENGLKMLLNIPHVGWRMKKRNERLTSVTFLRNKIGEKGKQEKETKMLLD